MKKSLLFFIIFLLEFSLSFSQVWTIIPKDSILPKDSIHSGKYATFHDWGTAIYKNNLALADIGLITYIDGTWKYLYPQDLQNMVSDTNFKKTHFISDYGPELLEYDSKGNLWGLIYYDSMNEAAFFKYDGEKIFLYTNYYDKNSNQYYDFPNYMSSFSFLKIDNFDNPWICYSLQLDSVVRVCKFENDRFIHQNNTHYCGNFRFNPHHEMAFDKENRNWQMESDRIFIFENSILYKIIPPDTLYQFGYGYDGTNILRSPNNDIYTLGADFDLYHYNDSSGWSFSNEPLANERIDYPLVNAFYASDMCIDSMGNVWVMNLYNNNLYRYEKNGKWTFYKIPIPLDSLKNHVNDIYIGAKTLQSDAGGRIYIELYEQGLYILDPNIVSVPIDSKIESGGLPDVWIYKIFPNPTTDRSTIDFFLNRGYENSVKVELFNSLGVKIKDIQDKMQYDSYNMDAKINFSVTDLPAGIYFVGVSAGESKKMMGFAVYK